MWVGQYNAILVVALAIAGVISYFVGNASVFMVVLFLVIVLRLGVGVLNLLSKAVRGKPIIYDVRIDRQADGSSRAS
jgi:hypothetical protein